jgi:hypothetical protein
MERKYNNSIRNNKGGAFSNRKYKYKYLNDFFEPSHRLLAAFLFTVCTQPGETF